MCKIPSPYKLVVSKQIQISPVSTLNMQTSFTKNPMSSRSDYDRMWYVLHTDSDHVQYMLHQISDKLPTKDCKPLPPLIYWWKLTICIIVTLSYPRNGQGPLGLADIRSATRLPPQPLGPPGVPLGDMGVM